MIHICKKRLFGRLSELRNTSHVNILVNLQIYGSHFEFRPLKKFPQGGFLGTFDKLFPIKFCII